MKSSDLDKLTSLSSLSSNDSDIVVTATKVSLKKMHTFKNSGNTQIKNGKSLKGLKKGTILILNTLKIKNTYPI